MVAPSSVAFGVGLWGPVGASLLEKTSSSRLEVGEDLAYLASAKPSKNRPMAPIAAPTPIPAFAPDESPFLEGEGDGSGLEVESELPVELEVRGR